MAIPTSRTKENAHIKLITERCSGCGKCVYVCKDFNLVLEDNKVKIGEHSIFGCLACGHCMAVCPTGAIEILGRELSPSDLIELPGKSKTADYGQILSLFQSRRSIREFIDKEIEDDIIKKIVDAASTAPMGLPPSDVHVLVIRGKTQNRAFAKDFSNYLHGLKYMTSSLFLAIMRPFWGKENDEMFREFIKPLMKVYVDDMKKGNNFINYDAPLAMYFYGSPYCDPADPIIAATYAMISAESLGLGTCMLGGIHPFIQSGRKAHKFREKYQIKHKSREGLFVIFGYPDIKYSKGIKRTFASVSYI